MVVLYLQSYRPRCRVAFCAEVVKALRYISDVVMDLQMMVHLSSVPQWLLVVRPVLEDVQVVA